ncbi:Uncharacterized protein Adt_28493 [Abeliophyllum distichum]|uniref:Uncharacterized protein n=1 Tax=Abeliophyllum distichum TaxID=126358 RepID=A0ABD1RWQ1_9LAMI
MATSSGELMSKNATEIWSFFQKQAYNSQQRSRSSRTEPKKRGIYEIRSNEPSSEIKEFKRVIEDISRKLTSLTPNNSTKPDACTDQANALNMMRKPPYNPFFNTYNPGWMDHPNFSWSQGGQQDNTSSQVPQQTTNQNFAQPKPWDEVIQKLTKATQAALEHQNHTIVEFKNKVRASQNLQAQSISNLENVMGQRASSVQQLATTIEKEKIYSQPFPNPKGVHNTGTDSSYQ